MQIRVQLKNLAEQMTEVACEMDESTDSIREKAVRLRAAREVVYELMEEIEIAEQIGGSDNG